MSTYTRDGKDGLGATCAPGIYLFTVYATHNQPGGGDSVSDRAAVAFIMEDRLQNVTGQDDKQDFQAKVQGTVADSSILRIDPLLTVLGSDSGASSLSSPSPTTISDWLQVARVEWAPEGEVKCQNGSFLKATHAQNASLGSNDRIAVILACWAGRSLEPDQGGVLVDAFVERGWLVIAPTRVVDFEEIKNFCGNLAQDSAPLFNLQYIKSLKAWLANISRDSSLKKKKPPIEIASNLAKRYEKQSFLQLFE